MRQAALGLQYAHELHLIHRDVKPANLFLCLPAVQVERLAAEGWEAVPFAEEAPVKVLDWGLASLERPVSTGSDAGHAATAVPLGTADYVSPEQALGQIDIRSDVYSLGCTFYYLLAATPPFPGGSIMQKLLRHQQGDAVPLTAHRQDIPVELQAVIQKMMAKRPSERYQTPGEVVAAVTGLLMEAVRRSRPVVRVPITPPPPRKDATEAERRTSIRHSCGIVTSCRPIAAGDSITWPVQVGDVSRSGIGMRVERRFEPGALLEIDLQSVVPHLDRTLLATVRNVRGHRDGDWVVGCLFARPLDDEELWAFRAAQLRPARDECQAWVRQPGAGETGTAQVVHVTPAGIALLLPHPIEAGVMLQLELQGTPDAPLLLKQVHVIHVTARAEGGWLVGCAFLGDLGEEEMFALTG
jgi:hypothetical protein